MSRNDDLVCLEVKTFVSFVSGRISEEHTRGGLRGKMCGVLSFRLEKQRHPSVQR